MNTNTKINLFSLASSSTGTGRDGLHGKTSSINKVYELMQDSKLFIDEPDGDTVIIGITENGTTTHYPLNLELLPQQFINQIAKETDFITRLSVASSGYLDLLQQKFQEKGESTTRPTPKRNLTSAEYRANHFKSLSVDFEKLYDQAYSAKNGKLADKDKFLQDLVAQLWPLENLETFLRIQAEEERFNILPTFGFSPVSVGKAGTFFATISYNDWCANALQFSEKFKFLNSKEIEKNAFGIVETIEIEFTDI